MNHSQPKDNDLRKGAFEDEGVGQRGQNSMQGQLPHRGQDAAIKDHDSDFPEPGNNPEHSGQKNSTELEEADRTIEPGFSQHTNQNWRKEDLLAA